MRHRVPAVPRVPNAPSEAVQTVRDQIKNGHSIDVLLEPLAVLWYDVSSQQADDRLAYSEQDAAKLLSISPRTLYSLRKEGKVHAIKIGNRVIYSREELLRFLESYATE